MDEKVLDLAVGRQGTVTLDVGPAMLQVSGRLQRFGTTFKIEVNGSFACFEQKDIVGLRFYDGCVDIELRRVW